LNPTDPKELFRKTADKLNLPEEYIQDVIEYYYGKLKADMVNYQAIQFRVHGLGIIRLRPIKFFTRQKVINKLIAKFSQFTDERSLMIRLELERRAEIMKGFEPEVKKYFEDRNIKMYGDKLQTNLEKQVENTGGVVE